MTFRLLALASLLCSATAYGGPPINGKSIFENLDLSSLPTTWKPRLEPGKIHFQDYGFELVKTGKDLAVIQLQDDTRFSIIVLKKLRESAVICLDELSLVDGARSRSALSIKWQDANLTATEETIHPKCKK